MDKLPLYVPFLLPESNGYQKDGTNTDKETDNKYLNKPNFTPFLHELFDYYYLLLPHEKFGGGEGADHMDHPPGQKLGYIHPPPPPPPHSPGIYARDTRGLK